MYVCLYGCMSVSTYNAILFSHMKEGNSFVKMWVNLKDAMLSEILWNTSQVCFDLLVESKNMKLIKSEGSVVVAQGMEGGRNGEMLLKCTHFQW